MTSSWTAGNLISIKARFSEAPRLYARIANRGLAMTNDVHHSDLPTRKSGGIGFDKLVIGILISGFASLVFYQLFYCATCYGTSIH
jgi:hypothetical protein